MFSIAKDCEVEVSSKDEGFTDSWYGAILLENPTISGRKKLKVRYTTLVDEDGSTLLTESVEQRFIRPVPPNDLNNNVDFEEGSVVDADLKDGWWTGIVIKKLKDQSFLVYFDSPPDLIPFERKQLRIHLDWICSKWVRPKNKVLSYSLFSPGTMVEVSRKIDKLEYAWVPALIVREIEEEDEQKFVVKCCDRSFSCTGDEMKPNITVDKCNIRPIPPPIFVEKYKLMEHVEAFRGSGWRQGEVRGILSEKRYTVCFLVTKEESVFKHSNLRPSQEWKDGIWRQGPEVKPGDKSPPNRKRKTKLSEINELCGRKKLKIIRSSTPAKPITPAPASLSSRRNGVITPKRTKKHTNNSSNSAENNCEFEKERSETVAAMELPLNKESGNKMADDVMNGDDHEQPLSSWILGRKSDKSYLSPDQTRANKDSAIVLPFEKQSSIWKVIESMDIFKTGKHCPHFTPLLETREEFREGSAVGEMVKYSILLERVKNLHIHTPNSTLEGLKECFYELEKYGFDATGPISRIDMLFSLKDEQMSKAEELRAVEKKMTEEVKKKEKGEEDLREVEHKILKLQGREVELKEKNETCEKEIAELRLCVADIDKRIQNVELEFQMTVAAPW